MSTSGPTGASGAWGAVLVATSTHGQPTGGCSSSPVTGWSSSTSSTGRPTATPNSSPASPDRTRSSRSTASSTFRGSSTRGAYPGRILSGRDGPVRPPANPAARWSRVTGLVVRRARIGSGEADLRIEGDRIAAVGPGCRPPTGRRRPRCRPAAPCCPACTIITFMCWRRWPRPGRSTSGRPRFGDRAGLAAALAAAAAAQPRPDWIRAVGYHQSVAGDLDRDVLDRMIADRPVRVQHRSGILWVCNSAGLAALDAEQRSAPGVERDGSGRLTGRLWRMDRWLAARLSPSEPPPAPWICPN